MPPPGRPPLPPGQRREDSIPVRFTADERTLIEWAANDAAGTDNASISAWVRSEAVAAAKRRRRRHASNNDTQS
ncbi:hypothetical protein [Mycobacteroides abscessus]|uniref:hypothetical protein n=1 Tax=Mycobacteroides abscessus TaxID=36809 RepID=UPI0010425BBE|nr:hypothetical protein [Mycobacteroides abscessus]MDO2986929.1 hypothetical protein [Mycobacteroides abscessus subsp. abscessus]